MQEKRSIMRLPIVMNIIATICLCLLIPFSVVQVLATDYDGSLSSAWENVSNVLQSGILYLDNFGALVFVIIFIPLGIWSFFTFKVSHKELPEKRWAGILFGVTLLMITCFLSVCMLPLHCVDEYHCALPIRPGVTLPTPEPYSSH